MWKRNGVPVEYSTILDEFCKFEQTLSTDTGVNGAMINERDRCQAARLAVLAVEGDGQTQLPDSNPNKQIWFGYFGPWMDAHGITHD
jgi:hypothetical protein